MPVCIDINKYLNKKYNKLTIIKDLGFKSTNYTKIKIVLCSCECGNEKILPLTVVITNRTKSCGCLLKYTRPTHGMCNHPIYSHWAAIKSRCYIKSAGNYKSYGGKGVTVCKEWNKNFLQFYNWAINNGYKKGLTLDRKNNNKGYTPENCRWVSTKEQNNNKTNNIYIKYNGIIKTLPEWSEFYGIKKYVLWNRLFKSKRPFAESTCKFISRKNKHEYPTNDYSIVRSKYS